MSKRVKMKSPNGGVEIEVFESEVDQMKAKGFEVVTTRQSKPRSKQKGDAKNGDVQG